MASYPSDSDSDPDEKPSSSEKQSPRTWWAWNKHKGPHQKVKPQPHDGWHSKNNGDSGNYKGGRINSVPIHGANEPEVPPPRGQREEPKEKGKWHSTKNDMW